MIRKFCQIRQNKSLLQYLQQCYLYMHLMFLINNLIKKYLISRESDPGTEGTERKVKYQMLC